MKRLRTIVFLCIFFLVSDSVTALASQPKVMVTDYKVKESRIVSGQEFHLEITIKNTGSRYVDNMKITVASENGDIIPASGAGTVFLEELADGAEETFTFSLKAAEGLEEKSYKLTVTTDYDDIWGNPYTATDTIYLPISMEQRASVTDVYTEDTVTLGDSIEIIGSVNNMGAGTLYNVRASVDSKYLTDTDTFIGNVEPGKSGSIDLLTNTKATTDGKDELVKLNVTYEDKSGNETTLEKTFMLCVEAPVYKNVEKIKDETKNTDGRLIAIAVAAVIVICAIVIMAVKKKRRKKAILEEFDD